MERSNLERLTELSAAFHHAVNNTIGAREDIREKVLGSLQPGEMEALQEQLQDVVSESMKYAFGGEPSDDFLKKNIAVAEKTADLSLRAVAAEEIAGFLPAELKNEADAASFASLGAPKLASLCGLKK